jgi:hypothetical protein
MNIKQRWTAESPEFWKKIKTIGIGIGTVGAFLISGTVALPVAIVTAGGYLVAVGTVTSLLAKLTVK